MRGRIITAAVALVVLLAIGLDATWVDASKPRTSTGREAFDPAAFGEENFEPKVVPAIEEAAVPIDELVPALVEDEDAASERYGTRQGSSPYNFSVTGTGTAGEVNGTFLPVTVKGLPKDTSVQLQIGPAINGTALRDAAGYITFNQFTNQVEYADAATALNDQVKAKVLQGFDAKAMDGKRVTFTGAFQLVTPNVITITPISLEAA
jgi:predicted lipoprotein